MCVERRVSYAAVVAWEQNNVDEKLLNCVVMCCSKQLLGFGFPLHARTARPQVVPTTVEQAKFPGQDLVSFRPVTS